MPESLKKEAVKGVAWSAIERFSVQGIQFLIMIVMARLLSPKDYGLVGMLTIFIAVSQSLIDSGFSQALIRKQNRTEVDNSTAFYFNIVVGIFLYGILFSIAPFVADFYDTPELTSLMRVVCLSVVLNYLTVVQVAQLTIRVDFKTLSKASLVSAVLSGVVGICMAYNGYGVWSIAAQQLTNLGGNAILLWLLTGWRPIRAYSWKSFKSLFSFGSKLMCSGLLDTIYTNVYLLVIGKVYSASDLGYYTRAHQFASFPSANLTSVMQRVTYPILCKVQDDDKRLASTYRRFLRVSAFVIFPLLLGLSAVAEPLVLLLLKEKWMFSATLLQIICFSMMWFPIHSINLNLLKVKGRSDLFLRLEVIKKVLGVAVLCITIPLGLIAMCIGSIFSSVIGLIINTYYTGKFIHLGFFRQMKDILPTLLLSVAMWLVVLAVQLAVDSPVFKLFTGISVGIIFYVGVAFLFRFSEFKEIVDIIKRR